MAILVIQIIFHQESGFVYIYKNWLSWKHFRLTVIAICKNNIFILITVLC